VPQNAATFGVWFNDLIGVEGMLGYAKTGDTATTDTTTQTNNLSTPQTSTTATTRSGTVNPSTWLLGAVIKFKFYQNSWFQFYGGGLFLFTPSSSAVTPTGTTVVTTPDTTKPGNATITETAIGGRTVHTDSTFSFGPKFGTEFYIKWFPHLAVGFGTGILATTGGDVTTTISSRSRNYAMINGVAQPATGDVSNPETTVTKPGMVGTTFGIGGTVFQFTGIFTIRYVW
jgi:hypothetical protein